MCFLVMVSKENSFCFCGPLRRERQFVQQHLLCRTIKSSNCILEQLELFVEYFIQLCQLELPHGDLTSTEEYPFVIIINPAETPTAVLTYYNGTNAFFFSK